MTRRVLALLLCLVLLPVSALASAHENAPAARFRLAFDMNPEAYPDDARAVTPGIADLLRVLTIEGQLAMADGEFELKTDLLLGGIERTRTDLRLFGTEELWHIRSSLLGNETLTMVMRAFLEFAVKGYSHLGIPLQRAAILVTPFVHTAPLRGFYDLLVGTVYAEPGTHTVLKSDLMEMAAQARALADSDIQFGVWTRAMAMETGYDGYLADLILTLPEWLETFMPLNGLTITRDEAVETWTTNALTLFRREQDQSGGQVVSVALPPMLDGNVITLDASLQPDGDLYHGSLNLLIDDGWGGTLLDLRVSGSLPARLPITRDFSLIWDAEGLIVGGEGAHLLFEGEPTATGVILRQWTPDRSTVMLTVTADIEPTQANFSADPEGESVYILSVNGETLSELMSRIASPMIRGLLPLIAQAPTSSCQTLMNLLEDSGVFALLTEGFASEGDEWEWDD